MVDQPQRCRAHCGRCPRDATTGARGWDEEYVTMMAVYSGRWRPDLFWFSSILNVGNVLCGFLDLSSGGSCKRRSCANRVICSDLSDFSGHKARVACACVAAASACPVLLHVPTPGVSLDCARHLPRPLPLPGRLTGGGVAGSVTARAGEIGWVTSSVTGM